MVVTLASVTFWGVPLSHVFFHAPTPERSKEYREHTLHESKTITVIFAKVYGLGRHRHTDTT